MLSCEKEKKKICLNFGADHFNWSISHTFIYLYVLLLIFAAWWLKALESGTDWQVTHAAQLSDQPHPNWKVISVRCYCSCSWRTLSRPFYQTSLFSGACTHNVDMLNVEQLAWLPVCKCTLPLFSIYLMNLYIMSHSVRCIPGIVLSSTNARNPPTNISVVRSTVMIWSSSATPVKINQKNSIRWQHPQLSCCKRKYIRKHHQTYEPVLMLPGWVSR